MEITADKVKALREKSGAGVMECKRVLTEVGGHIDKAIEVLRQRGLAMAERKAGRVASQGAIEAYVHPGNRIGVLVELNCETDFVARTPEFKDLAHDLALQVAAMNPRYLAPEDVPAGVTVNAEADVLLSQAFVKDPTRSVNDLIKEAIARIGENIKVGRFVRFELGG